MQGETNQIFIRNLRVDAIVGIHPHEREKTQPLLIQVCLWVRSFEPALDDRIENTVDYHRIANLMSEHAVRAKAQLLERLAHMLVEKCFDADERIESAQITLEKPNAIPNARCGGVTLRRSRPFR